MPLVNFAESSIIIMFLTPAPPRYQFGGLCALFHLSPFLLIGGDSISSKKFLKRLAIQLTQPTLGSLPW